MPKMPERLLNELLGRGNLPLSREGIERLRPDLTSEVTLADAVLKEELDKGKKRQDRIQFGDLERSILVARFVPLSEGLEQFHLFVVQDAESTEIGIKRWSKRPVSYGSFVQIRRFLVEAWGEIRDLHVQKTRTRLSR